MLGLLRANHFVNSHEQGVRTKGRAGRATVEQLAPGSARTGGGQKLVALVVRLTRTGASSGFQRTPKAK